MAKTMGARARAKAWDLRAGEHESRSFDFLLLNYIHLHLSRPSIHIPINWKQAHRSIDAAPLIYEQRSVHEMWKVLVRESVINIVKVIQSIFISSTPGTQPPQPLTSLPSNSSNSPICHTQPNVPNSITTTATICKKLYRKRSWHATDNCEDSNKILIRQFRKMRELNSNFFNMHGVVPPAQKVIANRNWSSSSFLRLPPEIRGRIYAIVFGGEKVHVGRTDNKINLKSKNQLNWKKNMGIWENTTPGNSIISPRSSTATINTTTATRLSA